MCNNRANNMMQSETQNEQTQLNCDDLVTVCQLLKHDCLPSDVFSLMCFRRLLRRTDLNKFRIVKD